MSISLTPQEASLRGRIGAFALHAKYDPRETTAKARATFLAKFLAEVDPDNTLPEVERVRRAEAARKAHFARLALKSVRARARQSNTSKKSQTPRGKLGAAGLEVAGDVGAPTD